MKTLKESILSDIDTTLSDKNTNAQIRRVISKFLKDNFKGRCTISNTPNSDGLFEVSSKYNISTVKSNITKLTNDLFIWTNVEHNFECVSCPSLTSLKGGPKYVGGYCSCINCPISSLEGAPDEVGGDFNCSYCGNITSLEGAPKKVGGDFWCMDCGKIFYKLSVLLKSRVKGHIYCKGNDDDIDPDTLARLGLKYDDR